MSRTSRRQALLSGLGITAAALLAADPEKIQASSKAKEPDVPKEGGFASRLARANSLPEIEAVARDVMVQSVYQWTSGGAADEITLRWNREALERIRLQPRVLVDVSVLDTRIKLLGHELRSRSSWRRPVATGLCIRREKLERCVERALPRHSRS